MTLNSQAIKQLFDIFTSSANAHDRKAADNQLVTLRQTAINYPTCILELIASYDLETQLRAAI